MDFEWDAGKDAELLEGRGFGFADALPMFAGDGVLLLDARRDYGEVRYRAIGRVGGDFYTVALTFRGGSWRLVTAWKSSRKERRAWRRLFA